MKKLTIILVAIFSLNQITAQIELSRNIEEITKDVHNANSEDNILETLNLEIDDFEVENEISYEEEFELDNEQDVLDMFGDLIKARKNREIPKSIWDNFNVGDLLHGNINADGSINIEGFIGNIPMPDADFDLDIGSDVGGNRNNRSYAGSGYGRNKGSGVGDLNNPTGNYGNKDFNGVPGQGHDFNGGTGSWDVNATHTSSKNSNGDTTTSFFSHTSSVSNDSGYHSETNKQHYNNGDGTWVTTVNVSQTQADGSNATSNKTVTKDEDGTVTTTTTVTKTDSDGNVVSEKTTEKKEKKEEQNSGDPREDHENGNPPPGPIEIQMAIFRAVTLNSMAGGSIGGDANDPRGDANTTATGNGVMKINDGSTLGNMKPKTAGGKINLNKVHKKQQVIKTIKQ
ncbi:hypothetical protein SAMN05444411_101165 [Lutibacter oricola]|uniref:Uncharacterized protein n=1 Tax=Lutibacter oricola TaxID=762486 RepID=A0A1H2R7L1_9FLAO|nr:hypothetical protein [Lutibacter oricola]SDW15120.1 hypothetical protein SAMN05444411_101165 [Lutibacter oricola]